MCKVSESGDESMLCLTGSCNIVDVKHERHLIKFSTSSLVTKILLFVLVCSTVVLNLWSLTVP